MNHRAVSTGLERVAAERFAADGTRAAHPDDVVVEEPLEIRVAGETLAITMRTPGHDHELVAGFLLSEGVIDTRDALGSLKVCGALGAEGYGNVLDALPAPGVVLETEGLRRGTLTTSACGVCGRRSIDDLQEQNGELSPSPGLLRSQVGAWLAELNGAQANFQRSGGLHAAGIAEVGGGLLCVREDVGRHNAVDKVLGRLLLDGRVPLTSHALVVSGRASFGIVQKAWRARASAVVAVSAPTSLAIATAQRAGITLIGFARDAGFNVYSHPAGVLAG